MYFTNITGGEPFIRTDLKDIVRELYKKSDRIVISTNGSSQIVSLTCVKSSRRSVSVFLSRAWSRPIMRFVVFKTDMQRGMAH